MEIKLKRKSNELFKTKEDFLKALHVLYEQYFCMKYCNEYNKENIEYIRYGYRIGNEKEMTMVRRIKWEKYTPELFDYIRYAQRKLKHYPTSRTYQAICDTLEKIKLSVDLDEVPIMLEKLFEKYIQIEEENKGLPLKYLNENKRSKRKYKRDQKFRKRCYFAEEYINKRMDMETAMQILEIKDKRTFFKYVDKVINDSVINEKMLTDKKHFKK